MSVTDREARAIVRKAVKRIPEGENISEINIMPLMDIMTILLVAVISMVAASASAKVTKDTVPPVSQTQEELPKDAVSLTVSRTGIIVDDAPILSLSKQRLVPSEELEGKANNSRYIPKLGKVLGAVRGARIAKLQSEGKEIPKIHELWVFADKGTPYQTLLKVLYSARHKDAGYRRFRLIVIQNK